MTAAFLRPALLVLALAGADYRCAVPPGAAEGRDGNALYADSVYAEAAAQYARGLARHDSLRAANAPTDPVAYALTYNLGSALHQTEAFAPAQERLETAAALAAAAGAGADAEASALYNAGNAAARQQEFEAALALYRRALLLRPGFEDARFNWEILRRRLQEDRPQQPPPEDVEPSPFAERLKAEADALVAARRYADALELMEEGLQQDSTVAAYRDFLGRLDAVVAIEEGPPAGPSADTLSAR